MPINPPKKYKKYHDYINSTSPDILLHQMKLKAEQLSLSGIQLTLQPEEYFPNEFKWIFASLIPHDITPYHKHGYFEINYVVRGKCVQYIQGAGLLMNAGDFLIMPPAASHTVCSIGDSVCRNVLIKTEWLKAAESRFCLSDKNNYLTQLLNNHTYIVFGKTKKQNACITAEELYRTVDKHLHAPYNNLYIELLAEKLLIDLASCTKTFTFFTPDSSSAASSQVFKDIVNFIQDNIASVTLKRLSEHFNYSESHLSRLFKKYTGNGFSLFLASQRMLIAEDLLAKTDMPINDILAVAGFRSKEHFFRLFKKNNGMTPLQFRKKHWS